MKGKETEEWRPDWEFRRELKNLSPKEASYEIKSSQPKMTKRPISSNTEYARARGNSEIKCRLERQQDGHFRPAIITSDKGLLAFGPQFLEYLHNSHWGEIRNARM